MNEETKSTIKKSEGMLVPDHVQNLHKLVPDAAISAETGNAIVQNVVANVTDRETVASTQRAFEEMLGLDSWSPIATAISNRLADELAEKSFMSTDLELTEKQKEALRDGMGRIVSEVVRTYKAQVQTDERAGEVFDIVRAAMRGIIERVLSGIGAEINRGAVINAVAVSADSKSKDFNKIELQYPKDAGDITIPTKGVFISTNCVETIRDAVCADGPRGKIEETEE